MLLDRSFGKFCVGDFKPEYPGMTGALPVRTDCKRVVTNLSNFICVQIIVIRLLRATIIYCL